MRKPATIVNFLLFLLSVLSAATFSLVYAIPRLPASTWLTSVPFDAILNPYSTITADYSFGDHAMIFCSQSNANISVNISWPYQGHTNNQSIPILLKTRPEFDGQFADPNGSISLSNNTGSSVGISCTFGF